MQLVQLVRELYAVRARSTDAASQSKPTLDLSARLDSLKACCQLQGGGKRGRCKRWWATCAHLLSLQGATVS